MKKGVRENHSHILLAAVASFFAKKLKTIFICPIKWF